MSTPAVLSTPPVVSVLLPAFNAANTLGECLWSLQRQTLSSWDCVLVDDGSTDSTALVARQFATSDPRIRLFRNLRQGLVASLNFGLRHCRGRFIARMDADDVMHRGRLAAQVEALETDTGVAAVGCHVRLFPRQRLTTGQRDYERWLNTIDTPARVSADAFIECPIAHPTLMAHRRVLAAFMYRDREWPEDYDLVLRMLAAGCVIGVVPRRLLAWRDAAARLSRRDPRYAINRFTACKAAFLAAGPLAQRDRYILWGFGQTGRSLNRALRHHGRQASHIIEMHPGRLGNTIHGAPVLPPWTLPHLPRLPLIVSVAGERPRTRIREALREIGFRERRDFICAA